MLNVEPNPPIEQLALLSNRRGTALVDSAGSLLYAPYERADGPAVFAALLGTSDNGHCTIRPVDSGDVVVSRAYRPGGVLRTLWTSPSWPRGAQVTLLDHMPEGPGVHVTRTVTVGAGLTAEIIVRPRFDEGLRVPVVVRERDRAGWSCWRFEAGGQVLYLTASAGCDLRVDEADGAVVGTAGQGTCDLVLSMGQRPARPITPRNRRAADAAREAVWLDRNCTYRGQYEDLVKRSMLTLRALQYEPSGALLAAASTSLPEEKGGVRNWDYRAAWIRDGDVAVSALAAGGDVETITAWRDWIVNLVGPDPSSLQIMYGIAGERELPERTVDHLSGWRDSRPVRVGNAAVKQHQLDVYGSLANALTIIASRVGWTAASARLTVAMGMAALRDWRLPDSGLWEVRLPDGALPHFVHSKVLAWVAVDRAARLVASRDVPTVHDPGLAAHLHAEADVIHAHVMTHGWNTTKGAFTQSYGSAEMDASALLLPRYGFLPAAHPRIVGTVDAVLADLTDDDGLVLRYRTSGDTSVDGLPGDEGRFLVCSAWLAEALAAMGRGKEAAAVFKQLAGLANDLGLLAEEYHPRPGTGMLGNFPQAFSHAGVVSAAVALQRAGAFDPTARGAAR
ncbi:glycoside hydrolase family 15 protein (plasmid) [Streptomyces sp. BI20]|uniref:glycoside hydrolase family 15 protein n=1 Tax=Streptomyces sp. BI20 TaxID=3403460 RepID=UPI003C77EE7C